MKKDIDELQRKLDLTVRFMERQLEVAFGMDCLDPMREQYVDYGKNGEVCSERRWCVLFGG